jgi:hypothetical protein
MKTKKKKWYLYVNDTYVCIREHTIEEARVTFDASYPNICSNDNPILGTEQLKRLFPLSYKALKGTRKTNSKGSLGGYTAVQNLDVEPENA